MSDIVIREVATNVWTFSRPFALFGWIHIGGRSTAVKLASGGVWVVASTPLSPETKAKLDALGPVEYIIGINAMHNMFLGEFKRAYPTAKLIAPAGAVERCSDKTLTFDGLWGKDPADTKYGFEDEIKACYFSGFSNKDVCILPRTVVYAGLSQLSSSHFLSIAYSRQIEADLVVNLPGTEQSSQRFPFYGPFGKPVGWLQGKLSAARSRDPVAMKRDVQTVAEWDFVRIIPCHGDVLETDAKKIWKDALRSHL